MWARRLHIPRLLQGAQCGDKIRSGYITPSVSETPQKGGMGDPSGYDTCAVSACPKKGGFKMAA